jgi:hypothetical protein
MTSSSSPGNQQFSWIDLGGISHGMSLNDVTVSWTLTEAPMTKGKTYFADFGEGVMVMLNEDFEREGHFTLGVLFWFRSQANAFLFQHITDGPNVFSEPEIPGVGLTALTLGAAKAYEYSKSYDEGGAMFSTSVYRGHIYQTLQTAHRYYYFDRKAKKDTAPIGGIGFKRYGPNGVAP